MAFLLNFRFFWVYLFNKDKLDWVIMTVAIIRCILCRTPWTTATSTCWIEVLHHKCRQSVAFSVAVVYFSLNLILSYQLHTFEHLHWAVYLPLLCLFLYVLLAQCLLVVSARLLDLYVKPRWRKYWLKCFDGHYVSLLTPSWMFCFSHTGAESTRLNNKCKTRAVLAWVYWKAW